MKKLLKSKKGVFGLNAVQSFFATILGLALLGYIIVIIMGILSQANILTAGSTPANQSNAILMNVSSGISGFFASINPVYAILAILVIILILVVLVRVVQTPGSGSTPSL